ncbi:hypothetical protein KP509_17G049700 [Ceratopteris richardii]|uniref:Uncharacterized protein n=1 Tax=Ceratopteris richardii TaxID=49495 RepID=A0A8T2SU57_CERRI|nr:hypothetical protein KP509_17G049700 [Ceratopteris richardii]
MNAFMFNISVACAAARGDAIPLPTSELSNSQPTGMSDLVWNPNSLASCDNEDELGCRDSELAFHLKLVAILTILCAGAFGVALPLLGRRLTVFKTDGPYFAVAKAFAAGVILATGFVHMLSDATEALTDTCLPDFPWKQFPFSGCIAMVAALGTLMLDVIGTEYYERKHEKEEAKREAAALEDTSLSMNESVTAKDHHASGHLDGEHIHVIGVRAHAVSHTHSHSNGSLCGNLEQLQKNGTLTNMQPNATSEDMKAHIRHLVVSQVLELGVVTHSIIIGVSLGVSQSPCTIRPLIGALSFHQFFEGFALGGCISEAGFQSFSTIAMSMCFTLTTPLGIGVGTGLASSYSSNSPGALIVEGIFDAVSSGILIYMALVDLIAADFLSKRMCCNSVLQVFSYISLFLGAIAMSALALWA